MLENVNCLVLVRLGGAIALGLLLDDSKLKANCLGISLISKMIYQN